MGNKQEDYTDYDLLQCSQLMESIWQVIDRIKAENELQAVNEHLDKLVQKRTEELSEAIREIESFSYTVSHDLRAPIRRIASFHDLILQDAENRFTDQSAAYFGRIRANILHMNRLTDVAYAVGLLEEYGDENGYCVVTTDQSCDADSDCPGDETCEPGVPTLATGTFVRSYSTSTWPSWSAELGNALGAAVPEDPINEFSGCTDDGYESATCWNASAATFECPEGSHVYGYRSVGGSSFDLYAQLEYTAGTWAYDFESTLGDLVIEQDWGGSTSALMAGFTATPTFCDGTAYGDSAVCGDGVLGSGEFCEIGDTYDADCDVTYSYQCADPSTYFPAYARTCSGLDDTTSCTGTYYDTCVETSTGSFICAALEAPHRRF